MENYQLLWNRVLEQLEKSISGITFSTFIEKLEPVDLEGSTIILHTDSKIFATGAMRVSAKILDAFEKSGTGITDFSIFIADSKTPFYTSAKVEEEDGNYGVEPKYTFDSFVVGESNRFAYAAAKAVAEDPGFSYNPLFVYGSSGLGKTHLVQAVANQIKSEKPNLKVMYTTCEKFTNEIGRAHV